MMVVEFVLLLFMNGSELKEYTARDSMSACLKAKRMASRQLMPHTSQTRYECKKLKILIDDTGKITEILGDG